MTATPPIQKRFRVQQFLQPAWLAGAISIGFHSVLFAAGPTFPSLGFEQLTEETIAERRNVPLVELTAAEQERLPDFSNSFYDFGNFGNLGSLDPLFEGSSSFNSGDRVLNSKPLLAPDSGSLPPSGASSPFDITRLAPRSGATFPLSGGLPSIRTRDLERSAGTESGKPPAATTPNSTSPGAEALRPSDESAPISPQTEQEIAANSNPTDTLTLEERLQAYTFNDTQTSTDQIASSYGDWLAAGQAFATDLEIGEADAISNAFEAAAAAGILSPAAASETDSAATGIVQSPIELEIEYGAGICLTKEPQKGLVGAWVGPAGELLGEPEVIRSTGYLGLNQQAVRYIKTLDFSSVETFTGYQFEVLVAYDPEGCVEIGRNTPTPNTAAPANSDTNAARKAPPKSSSPAATAADEETSTPASPAPAATNEATPDSETPAPEASDSGTPDR